MAYQNVGTPRFFIDNYQYLRMLGLSPNEYIGDVVDSESQRHKNTLYNPSAYTLDPIRAKTFVNQDNASIMRFHIPMGDQVINMNFSENMKWYTAILNHNFGSKGINLQNSMFMDNIGSTADNFDADGNPTTIMNLESGGLCSDGTSIFYTDNLPSDENRKYTGFQITTFDNSPISDVNIGAISQGVMYTMPKTPNLKLTMVIENDGYKSTATLGGSTLTNITYTGAPNWVNGGKYMNQFGVGEYYDNSYLDGAKQNGRKSWSLKFSYISDTDLFSSNYMKGNYTETPTDYDSSDLDANNQFEYNMFTDNSFIAQVWNKVYGLPFIFQPDSNNNNPDQFNLCMFDQDSLSINSVAYKTYDISVRIVQVW